MANFHFWLLVEFMILANLAFAGAALVYWAEPLSQRYSAWTIRFRKKHTQISKPPNPETAELNHKTMVVALRVTGAILIAEAFYFFVHSIHRIPR